MGTLCPFMIGITIKLIKKGMPIRHPSILKRQTALLLSGLVPERWHSSLQETSCILRITPMLLVEPNCAHTLYLNAELSSTLSSFRGVLCGQMPMDFLMRISWLIDFTWFGCCAQERSSNTRTLSLWIPSAAKFLSKWKGNCALQEQA